jgi:predicted ribosomally synthesized peptide with SipW-like signal peptide
VLGVGVGVTLAAWNDSEFAQGTYTAGVFNLEGTTDNTTWADYDTTGAGAATLDYSIPGGNLSPDDVTYAPYALRLDDTTTTDAAVTFLAEVPTTGSIAGLTYQLILTGSFACNATVVSTAVTGDILVNGEVLDFTVPTTVTFDLPMGTPNSDPLLAVAGVQQNLCFVVTANSGLVQAQTGTSTIVFTAASTTAP